MNNLLANYLKIYLKIKKNQLHWGAQYLESVWTTETVYFTGTKYSKI